MKRWRLFFRKNFNQNHNTFVGDRRFRWTVAEWPCVKVSEDAQARLGELLEKNREGTLNETESAELDLSEQLDRLMTLLKAKAYAESIQ
ncbi:hypothetical protein [Laspinema olomoucense]|uniref:hypothetical protein n=1 Tax=Laspinema olomoucense TaxID=3231600 RepID=UPI0021BA9D57|nr:hypothetical protein [Laspinema sp. D3a]MCT7989509.1 hypothetical protein [Laspinema sp. D3a]